MTLLEWGALGELIGGVAIIASLIYVGRQVKENTTATKSAAAQAMADTMNGYVGLINASSNLSDILHRGATGLDNLQGGEVIQFGAFHDQMFICSESLYYQWSDGVLDEHLWNTYRHAIVDILMQKGSQDWWENRRHWFGTQFAAAVEELCSEVSAKPMHFASVEA